MNTAPFDLATRCAHGGENDRESGLIGAGVQEIIAELGWPLRWKVPGRKANPRCTPTEAVEFYDSLKMQNVSHPSALLADEMNHALLRVLHGLTFICALRS